MEFFIGWILFGVGAGSVAKGKNRSVALWVVLGLLIGPFAILIIALLKTVPVVKQEEESGRLPE
jgi:hypothetical protein